MQTAVALTENNLVLGRYRPLRPLGSGGGGSVWLARDEHEDRDVALKVVEREGKPGARAEREVDAATRLRHPRCLRALALARDDNHVYVAYPYVAGRTLRDALRNGAVDDWGAVEAGAQVLEALAHAHSKGVVHRDVKPANVMLEEGDEVSVRLLDFGLAQLEQADTLTAFGDVPGTLAYIAPERLAGEETTGAADVWAVGVLLWESLAGRHPFWAVSPLETARRIEQGAQPLAELRPDLPRELTRAVDRMLSTDPRKRPHAGEALTLLRSAEEGRGERRRATTSPAVLRERAPHAALAALFAGSAAFLLALLSDGLAVPARSAGRAHSVPEPDRRPGRGAGSAGAAAREHLSRPRARLPPGGTCVADPLRTRRAVEPSLPLGPLLALGHLLPLVPVVALAARGLVRQAALAGAAVLAAVATVIVVGLRLPLTGEAAPKPRGVSGTEEPGVAFDALLAMLASRPSLVAAVVIAAVAAASAPSLGPRPLGRRGLGAAFLAVLLLVPLAAGGAPVDPCGQRRQSGWRRARSRIRWFGHPDRVTSGHNGCPV